MLRRSAILLVAGLLLGSTLACNFPFIAGLPLPNIPIVNPAPLEIPTAVSLVSETVASAEAQMDAGTPPMISAALSATPVEVKGAAGTLDEPVGTETMVPTMEIRFNTPTPLAIVESTLVSLPTIASEPTSTKLPLPAVELVPSPIAQPTIPLPTPIPLPAPVVTVPSAPQLAGDVPQVIWIEDLPGRPHSSVMAWRGGVSHPLFADEKYISRVLEFNVSADGTWLAYTTADTSSVWQVNTITGEQREIAPKYPWWCFRFPAWSPHGDLLAFVAGANSAPWASPSGAGLWVSQPDGSDMHQVGEGIGWANQQVLLAGWQPNGQELLYSVPDLPGMPLPQWRSVSVATGESERLPLKGSLFDVAPDGSWLLGDGFTIEWPGGRQEFSYNVLIRIPVDGSTPQVLTPACRSDIMGQVSPDGARIAFLSMPSLGFNCPRLSGPITYELWVMNSDGTDRRQIEIEGIIGSNSPQWSPDGSAVYYSAWDSTGSSLWMADAAGVTPPVRLEQTEGVDRFAVVK